MKMKKRLLSILLSLALVLGLMPGMVMTAYAAPDTTTYRLTFQGPGGYSGTIDTTLPCTLDYNEWLELVGLWPYDPVPEATVASGDEDCLSLENSNLTIKKAFTGSKSITNIFSYHYSVTITCLEMVNVNSISLDKDIAQTVNVGNNVAFTATVSPNNATDKTVKWSVGGTDTGAVTLYSDADCTAGNEVGTAATDTLTVYAKGVSAGSATVTVTSNADDTKYASCDVTVKSASATVTEAPTAKTLTYNGQAQELVTAGTATGGTMQYALGTETAATQPYTTSIPTATDAGTYYVWYMVKGDSNHNDSKPECVEVTINKKEETTEAPSSYKNEWVKGQWYDANGKTGYKPQGQWKKNSTGWWYVDEADWYPTNMWQKIDGKWYFFDDIGYMVTNAYAGKWSPYSEGYWWVGEDGAWDGSEPGVWRLSGTKWWFKDSTGWYAKGKSYNIGGNDYEFDADGWWIEK